VSSPGPNGRPGSDEAADAIVEIHPDLAPDVVAKRFTAMNAAFEDALVQGWEALEASIALPDQTIVTSSLRDARPGRRNRDRERS